MNRELFIQNFLQRRVSLFEHDIQEFRHELVAKISKKCVLVIGGAGTIGSSYVKAILDFNPGKVVIVDTNENELTELMRDLRSDIFIDVRCEVLTYAIPLESNVFRRLFKYHGPFDVVANFAAHKHVRSEKDIFSIEAMLQNNLINANKLLDLLTLSPPEHFFCVSTDKAANPVSIMGASKLLMEELIFSYDQFFKVSTARFANVAFSNGSLLDGVLRRISKGQPISCPQDVSRFFVTPKESGEICLLASVLGGSSEIFFPNLANEKGLTTFTEIIYELLDYLGYKQLECSSEDEAKEKINLIESGLYPVHLFNSDTSGEKLYEEFYTSDEEVSFEKFKAIGVIRRARSADSTEIKEFVNNLSFRFEDSNFKKDDLVRFLKLKLPNFNHVETGITLDTKM